MQTNSRFWKTVKTAGRAACKRIPLVRKLREVYWSGQQSRFASLSEKTATNSRMVVFEAFGGRKYACSPRAIYEAMCVDSRFADWTFVWSFQEDAMDQARGVPQLQRAKLVVRESDEYFNAFAAAKYWIQNNRVYEYMYPRPDQVYVQCWHGTPLKRLGYDVPETTSGGALNTARELADRFNRDALKWSYLVSPSAFTSRHLADAFGLPQERRSSVVLEVGYPRNDAIVNTVTADDAPARLAALRSAYGIPQGKKALLFAPTWRDDQFTEGVGYTMDSLMDFDALQRIIGDEWVVLLRTHYYIANKFDLSAWEGFVFNVSDVDDINDLYCIADALCTDYSSVFFDYANTARPLYFYWPDRRHYEQDLHGFYLDPDTLPGPKCETAEELGSQLVGFDGWCERYGEGYRAFREEFCGKDDGRAAQRVIEAVF